MHVNKPQVALNSTIVSSKEKRILRIKQLLAVIAICIAVYVCEGIYMISKHNYVELMASETPTTLIKVDGKPARIVFGYFLIVAPGTHRFSVQCPIGHAEAEIVILEKKEQYISWDCMDGTVESL